MSTNCTIIAKTENGYTGIYCHWDGYLSGVGMTLLNHYNDPKRVAALIALGNISLLGEKLDPVGPHTFDEPESGVTIAYRRDRGEPGQDALVDATSEEIEKAYGNWLNYVFDGEQWFINGEPLSVAITTEG